MTFAPVLPDSVRNWKVVYLAKDLPLGFGNRRPIIAHPHNGTRRLGYVTSAGFERGMLRVFFPLYEGDERVTFNVLSAETYLVCDPYR